DPPRPRAGGPAAGGGDGHPGRAHSLADVPAADPAAAAERPVAGRRAAGDARGLGELVRDSHAVQPALGGRHGDRRAARDRPPHRERGIDGGRRHARGIEERHGYAGALRAPGGLGALSGPPISVPALSGPPIRLPALSGPPIMVDVPRTADVVIIGGGVHGASLAYHFARKKAGRVLLIEKKFIASGPTGRSTALVRQFYAMDFFTRTASAAAEMFRHWKDVVGGDGDPGFQQVGMLALAGPDKAPHLRHNALRAQKVGARVMLISPADVKALVPAANVDDVALASYESESGYADPSSTANALANRARDLGATIVQYRHVDAIRTAGDKVVGVRSEGVDIDASVVVNCAGLWADRLLRPLGIEVSIKPERHQMCFFRRPSGFGVHPAVADSVQMT